MNPRQSSIQQQKDAGTYERNQEILKLVAQGISMAEIARQKSISRQRVFQLIKKAKGG